MKVLKFGGTSVGSVQSVKNVREIVQSHNGNVVVVVSALGGVTDLLLDVARRASKGDSDYLTHLESIKKRHIELTEGVVPLEKQKEILKRVNALLDELSNIYRGVFLIKDLSLKTSDVIVSYGERLSSTILSGVFEEVVLYDARKFIKTNFQYKRHICNKELSIELIQKEFANLPKVALVQGFIASDEQTGDVSNLGRGGSDYTASLVAVALNAEILEVWTDVDGFMTADPKVIPNAYVINRLSYVEAMELCNFGAKVIYPPTIYPVFHKNIPIVIKNTFNPKAEGTFISDEKNSKDPHRSIKGISSINDTCLVNVRGLGMVGVIGVNRRIFKALAKAEVSVFLVSQASSENSTSIGVKNIDAERAVKVLKEEFKEEIERGEIDCISAEYNLATIAIVGENMKHTPGIAGKLFGTLGRNGISVIACAQGASETNISFVVEIGSLSKALSVIHDSFFLSDYQELNLFLVGIGTVGGSLLEQIRLQQRKLMEKNKLKLNLVGVSNSKHCLFNRDGIDIATYKEQLNASPIFPTPEVIKEQVLKMNIFNSVFVDCTASPDVASLYNDFLKKNISVVCANKIAASGNYENYAELKKTARNKGIKFLFETNVGAGLPIISTMNALINSGDKILKMEAVLSGTLNYIFNTLSKDIPLSQTIRMAKEAGYAEPDPRIDLSGKDVVRKLVILSREAGYKVEQEDVKKNLFIPEKYFKGTLEEFWDTIGELDEEFEERRQELEKTGKRFRFVAKMENGETEVGLQEVSPEHPFYTLEGSNNIILITTERYNEYPMLIQGYGAGASVTAAGVFADIISIANI